MNEKKKRLNKRTFTETTQLVKLLKKVESGFLPQDVFIQIARLATLTTIELIAFWHKRSVIKVFLSQRPIHDDFWPKMWHIPGSILRPTDKKMCYHDALQRIIIDELANTQFLIGPSHFRNDFRKEARGSIHALQHWGVLKEVPRTGRLFALDNLPKEIVPEHRRTILLAAEAYLDFITFIKNKDKLDKLHNK